MVIAYAGRSGQGLNADGIGEAQNGQALVLRPLAALRELCEFELAAQHTKHRFGDETAITMAEFGVAAKITAGHRVGRRTKTQNFVEQGLDMPDEHAGQALPLGRRAGDAGPRRARP